MGDGGEREITFIFFPQGVSAVRWPSQNSLRKWMSFATSPEGQQIQTSYKSRETAPKTSLLITKQLYNSGLLPTGEQTCNIQKCTLIPNTLICFRNQLPVVAKRKYVIFQRNVGVSEDTAVAQEQKGNSLATTYLKSSGFTPE